MLILKIAIAALILFTTTHVHGAITQTSGLPSLISAVRVNGPLEFCGEEVPLHVQEVRERLEKELLLTLWDRPQVILWLKRSRRYLPHIEKILEENGLPEDLKYLAVAESALRRHAGSPKGALGFWQFMAGSGRRYGLVINNRIDQRRNLFASTRAAVRYLSELREMFGSWTLAAAAYNMGEEGLMAEILEQETNDYYHLYLSLETQRFVFRVLTVKLILMSPENYGFELEKEDYYPPLAFDRVRVDCLQDVPVRIIARAANTYFKVIKDLNPEIRGHYLCTGTHEILVPKGSAKGFQQRYRKLLDRFLLVSKERVYVVKKGDTLSGIAERFDIPLAALLIWNRLKPGRPIHPGQEMVIHPNSAGQEIEKEGMNGMQYLN